MGYRVFQRDSKFSILAGNKRPALNALLGYDAEQVLKNRFRRPSGNQSTLESLLKEWDWQVETDADGNITDICFENERLGEEYEWFDRIAPYVVPGSYIAFEGEDGAIWCHYFDGKRCTEHQGKIIFPSIPLTT